jgi:hypothetical protein
MSEPDTEFQGLLDDLSALHKALKQPAPQDDEAKIAAAAKADDADEDEVKDDQDDDDQDEDEDEDARPLSKSFDVTLSDGSQVEALDGTEALAALSHDLVDLRAQAQHRATATQAVLTNTVTLLKALSAEVASLRRDQQRLAKQPRGRQSVLHVPEPAAAADAMPDRDAILAKALQHLGPVEVAEVNSYLNMGEPVPAHLMKALNA